MGNGQSRVVDYREPFDTSEQPTSKYGHWMIDHLEQMCKHQATAIAELQAAHKGQGAKDLLYPIKPCREFDELTEVNQIDQVTLNGRIGDDGRGAARHLTLLATLQSADAMPEGASKKLRDEWSMQTGRGPLTDWTLGVVTLLIETLGEAYGSPRFENLKLNEYIGAVVYGDWVMRNVTVIKSNFRGMMIREVSIQTVEQAGKLVMRALELRNMGAILNRRGGIEIWRTKELACAVHQACDRVNSMRKPSRKNLRISD